MKKAPNEEVRGHSTMEVQAVITPDGEFIKLDLYSKTSIGLYLQQVYIPRETIEKELRKF